MRAVGMAVHEQARPYACTGDEFANFNCTGRDILRVLGLNADHPRTRERFLALYEICGDKSASQVGWETGRNPQTVMEWVHRYNTVGPAVLVYLFTPILNRIHFETWSS